MAVVTQTPLNVSIAANSGTLVPGLANAFRGSINAYVGTVEDKAQLVQAHAEGLAGAVGYGWLSGGTIAAGAGLNVTITALSAIVGNKVATDATGTVGMTASTVNYIFLHQDGTFATNPAGTVPSSAVHGTALLWGNATTNASAVTAVSNTRANFGDSLFATTKTTDTIGDGVTAYVPDMTQLPLMDSMTVYGTLTIYGKMRIL